MNEFILTTPDRLRQIINECIAENRQPQQDLNKDQSKLLYSLHELADFLGCSVVTAYKLKQSGKIRHKQFGRKLIFNTSEILEDIKNIGGIRHNKK